MNVKKIVLPLILLPILIFILIAPKSGKKEVELRPNVEIPKEYVSLVNTVSADESSLTRGEKLYAVYCDMCHGRTGAAKEGVTKSFEVAPSPLTDEKINSYTDGGLFYLITNGVEGTKMRPFKEMDEEDRWNVINYLRTLPKKKSIFDSISEFAL